MKQTYASVLSGKSTNQTNTSSGPCVPIQKRESEMAPNRGGGYGFIVTWQTGFQRFLILGTDKGYYTSADQGRKSI